MPEQPRVFVSSTIADFKDLRLALKYWLEEAGFQVFLSECNDFPVDPGSSTFQNCLDVLQSCHYAILIVGYRRGSYYDESKRISVTRAEYKKAYELVIAGRIKLLSCVRWEVQQDISSGNSIEFQDMNFTKEFLSEIKRDEEVREGIKGGGPFPKGNWVSSFRDFRELMQALFNSLRVGSRLRKRAIEANLAWELRLNLKGLLTKAKESLVPFPFNYPMLQQQLSLESKRLSSFVITSREQKGRICSLAAGVAGFQPERIATNALNEAINSGEFLEYEANVDKFTVGPVQASFLDLREEVSKLKAAYSAAGARDVALEALEQLRVSQIAGNKLGILFGLANDIHNVRTRMASLAAYLAGKRSEPGAADLLPTTPFADEIKALEAEMPTYEEVESWLGRYCG
jgi:hypothetical protein